MYIDYCTLKNLNIVFIHGFLIPYREQASLQGKERHGAPVAQLVEHRVVMREVVSSTPAGPTLLK